MPDVWCMAVSLELFKAYTYELNLIIWCDLDKLFSIKFWNNDKDVISNKDLKMALTLILKNKDLVLVFPSTNC